VSNAEANPKALGTSASTNDFRFAIRG